MRFFLVIVGLLALASFCSNDGPTVAECRRVVDEYTECQLEDGCNERALRIALGNVAECMETLVAKGNDS